MENTDQHTAGELLVEVFGVSKKFSRNLKTSLWYGLVDITKKVLGLPLSEELRNNEFWAVKEVSFQLRRGECIGLIGHNGAGKSTLLKVLNGLYNPDQGKIIMRGKVGALIELTAGFNPILTGRENIYNNAAILGFDKQEVNQKLPEIIDFSEIEDFLDMPVMNYSSGMKVRLGFAVAAFMDPDILIIDEVLAVGDLGFILKCFKKIDEILPKTAVIFVSHNMPMISRVCNEVILMDHGKVEYQGDDVGKGIDLYYKKFSNNDSNILLDDHYIEVTKVETDKDSYDWDEKIKIDLQFKLLKKLDNLPFLNLIVYDKEQRPVAHIDNIDVLDQKLPGEEIQIRVELDRNNFTKGMYYINLGIYEKLNYNPIYRANNVAQFQINYERDIFPPFHLASTWNIN